MVSDAAEKDHEGKKFDTAMREFGRWIATGKHSKEAQGLRDIADKYGTTRAMARDICLILQAKGMVQMRQRVGVTIQPMENWDSLDRDVIKWRMHEDRWSQLSELTELRLSVEPYCARLATERATAPQRGGLRRLADELEDAGLRWASAEGDVTSIRRDYLDLDQQFHRMMLAASGITLLRAISPAIDLALEARNGSFDKEVQEAAGPPQRVSLLLHDATATAIYLGHAGEAELCMASILHEVRGKMTPNLVDQLEEALVKLDIGTPENRAILAEARQDGV
ncbi:FCD domain-containing protein [Actinoplanes sp. NPDC051851]|uniref:FadR/GntR family transcriptional regulator n=1 Tax=Actinoplanes sp. NPDC051851 TaxID=3154753 RepID=UPI003416C478